METNDLKKLIGTQCEVIDPRSKNKNFEPAIIYNVTVGINKTPQSDVISERVVFGVRLLKFTKSTSRFNRGMLYQRCFEVSEPRIKLNN